MTDRPKLSLYVRNFSDHAGTDWNTTLETVRVMDAVGVDRVVVSDHVVFGENLSAYADPAVGGTIGGKQPTGPDGEWMEPLIFLPCESWTPWVSTASWCPTTSSSGRTCPPTPTRRWAERSAASSRRDRTASGWSR
ncbi:hypothetical protein Mkiyose1088_11090 [Mycobacterium kiyosense]|uniref:hypothetical protein n=1 Tax=Mycobacterium kiyosense TaxID=2871094 RepID=UPI0021748237|nr:hypothetical protein [Mycobacterium kiyosense]GLC99242.1 hypothetical protein Mkiyose1088_11090 [Mycobacterium kiyosense]